MLDQKKIKQFWDDRAKTYDSLAFESIANLEEDPENLRIKIKLETDKVFNWIGDIHGLRILDLGAGVGQWAFRFIDHGAKSVKAVEYSADLAMIGTREAKARGINNLDFIVSPAEEFVSSETFDIIFISGLFVYMNDDQADKLMLNIKRLFTPDTFIILRDGTGINNRHEINNKLSEHLKTVYSAIYRTRQEYINIFNRNGTKNANKAKINLPYLILKNTIIAVNKIAI